MLNNTDKGYVILILKLLSVISREKIYLKFNLRQCPTIFEQWIDVLLEFSKIVWKLLCVFIALKYGT